MGWEIVFFILGFTLFMFLIAFFLVSASRLVFFLRYEKEAKKLAKQIIQDYYFDKYSRSLSITGLGALDIEAQGIYDYGLKPSLWIVRFSEKTIGRGFFHMSPWGQLIEWDQLIEGSSLPKAAFPPLKNLKGGKNEEKKVVRNMGR